MPAALLAVVSLATRPAAAPQLLLLLLIHLLLPTKQAGVVCAAGRRIGGWGCLQAGADAAVQHVGCLLQPTEQHLQGAHPESVVREEGGRLRDRRVGNKSVITPCRADDT